MILKKAGCSIVHIIINFSQNFILQNENNEMSQDEVNSVIHLVNCLEVYKNEVLPINEILIKEYPETEATFKLVTGYYLSQKEVDGLEKLILTIFGREDLPNLLGLLNDLQLMRDL